MKNLILGVMAAGALAGAALPAFAQGPRPSDWRPLAQRQAEVEHGIDEGHATLTREEARHLRMRFDGLMRLEAREQAAGRFGMAERVDLQRRYDDLTARIHFEKRVNEAY